MLFSSDASIGEDLVDIQNPSMADLPYLPASILLMCLSEGVVFLDNVRVMMIGWEPNVLRTKVDRVPVCTIMLVVCKTGHRTVDLDLHLHLFHIAT